MIVGRSAAVAAATLALLVAGSLAIGLGCGSGTNESGVAEAKLPQGSHSEAVEHEACNESGNRVVVLDANGDGKPDIKRVYDKGTGKETCRISDLNHDGKPDLFEYFDSNGDVRRREADYDDNGVIDAIEYYEHGKLVRREYDTTGQHRIDTWDYFDPGSGKRTRRERDSTGDGRVDQWWTYDGDKVTIAYDRNGDGKPDPGDVIVLGGDADAGGPPAAPQAPTPPDAGSASVDAAAPASTVPASTMPASTMAIADAGPEGGAKRKEAR
jgi:hypothetical protein